MLCRVDIFYLGRRPIRLQGRITLFRPIRLSLQCHSHLRLDMCSSDINGYFKITFSLFWKRFLVLILSLEVTLYSPANKADFQMNGFVPGFGFDKSASRKGLFNFVLLLSRACNLQTAQSQTSVLNDTVYWSKFHVSGDLVTELRPTLNENISLFFS